MNALLTSKPNTTTLSEGDLTSLLTAWDQAHSAPVTAVTPAAVVDADWRHILDEIAHPQTIQAFHRLAEAAA